MSRPRAAAGFTLIELVIALAAPGAGGQRSTVDISPSLANPSLVGADTYAFYCAPCHGKDGKGRGPVAGALTSLPADLTTLAARNKGVFPSARVRDFVTSVAAGRISAKTEATLRAGIAEARVGRSGSRAPLS